MIGMRRVFVEERTEQRILRSIDGVQRPSAVEGVSKAHSLTPDRAAALDVDLERVRCLLGPDDPPRHDPETSLADQPLDLRSNLGRDAVAVDVPPRARMPEETSLLAAAQALPQAMTVRAQAVDGSPPPDVRASRAEPAPKFPDTSVRNLLLADRRLVEVAVRSRNLPPPGDCDDAAEVARDVERERQIDHRQPGADDERVA